MFQICEVLVSHMDRKAYLPDLPPLSVSTQTDISQLSAFIFICTQASFKLWRNLILIFQ